MKRLALVVLVGCGGDGLSQHEYDDVAAIAASSIASPQRGGTLGGIEDALTIARGDLPKGFVLGSDGIVFGTRGELLYRYQVMCLQPMLAACDPPARSVIMRGWWDGTLSMSSFTGPVHRETVWMIDGLDTEMAVVTGSSTLTSQRATFPDGDTYAVSDVQDQLMFADMAGRFMRGGAVTATLTVDDTFVVDVELGLDDGGTATLRLDGTHEYLVDLATGDVQ
jgi:hypothetical protein